VLTQFLSVSLHRHIRGTYNFDNFSGGFVEILAAQQTMAEGTDWYEGTADAVRKNLRYLQQPWIKHVLILSGDQLYRMNYADMLASHEAAGADVSIAALPVDREDAAGFGIMQVNDEGFVTGFVEKPKTDEEIAPVRMDPAWIDARGIDSKGRDLLASMGIYLFNRDMLVDRLKSTTHQDFGKEVFPEVIRERKVAVHLFDGYWEDIGTIKSFYEANLELTKPRPVFPLNSATAPIYTRPRFLPPTEMDGATVRQSLIAEGCLIEPGAVIENSVIGLRCRIGRNVTIRNSVVMGSDIYETPEQLDEAARDGLPPIGVGEGTIIDGAIIDKNVRIGKKVCVCNESRIQEAEIDDYGVVRDGICVIEKGATLPDGWKLES
jgi:glucose-1-phosphate adenylyltransferase